MTDRYARPTFKNLLGGPALAVSQQQQQPIQQQQTGQSMTLGQNGDENLHLLNKNLSLKIQSATLAANTAAHLVAAASIQSSSTALASAQQTLSMLTSQQQLASMRNALGDIGNRLGGASHQLAIKKENFVKLQPQQTVVINKSDADKFPKQTTTNETSNPNNSCVMEEVDDDDDDYVILDEESIVDIDEPDGDNIQLVANYVKDIYKYLNQVEKEYRISSTFLENKTVTAKMRAVLIDWLIQVHLKFHLLQETLYLCVQIIDAYLMAQDVPKMQLQLVGVTAMFLASKYEEMYVPAIDDFVYMTDNTYTKAEIRQMEISILKTLNFMFCKPLPLHFLRRFSKAGHSDAKQHTLAKYFLELSLHDAEFSSWDPSYLAATSLCLSFKLLNGTSWNRQMEYYSTYKQSSLFSGMQKIAKLVLKSMDNDYKYRAVTNKYGASKLMRIALLPELSSQLVTELALTGSFPSK